ncbi:hypothetical protein ACQKNB_21525 [Lysinibacillus xylanilyticus]|uniref:hypothetical protein n=1 Tax=Lysinibacillus xylanilyticus TaxID=582475 RepID=UPI003CFD815E
METGRLLGVNISGTKAKTITSCDNAFVTNIVPPQGSSALRDSDKCFICATATKRPVGAEINHTLW